MDVCRDTDRLAINLTMHNGSGLNCTLGTEHTINCDSVHHNDGSTVGSKVFIGIALQMIVVMTVGGNILVLLAVYLNRKLRTTTNYFVVSLAIADLHLGIFVLPFSAILQMEGEWMFGNTFCDIWAAVDVLCCTASILSLCAISIDRYIGVTRPLQHRNIMSSRRTLLMIVALWVSSFVISLGPLIGWRDKKTNPSECTVTNEVGYVIFSSLCSFYIPALVIIGIYIRIYKEAKLQADFLKTGFKTSKASSNGSAPATTLRAVSRKNLNSRNSQTSLMSNSPSIVRQQSNGQLTRKILTHQDSVISYGDGTEHLRSTDSLDSIDTRPKPTGSNKLKKLGKQLILGSKIAKFNKERKAAKTLGIVVGVFLVCWFPFFFILPLESLCKWCAIPRQLFDTAFWLGYCNSMLNPIIYATWNKEFKRTFYQILRCRCRQKYRLKKAVSYLARVSAQQMAQTATDKRQISIKSQTPTTTRSWNMSTSSASNTSIHSAGFMDGVMAAETIRPSSRGRQRQQAFSESTRSAPAMYLDTIEDTESGEQCTKQYNTKVDEEPAEIEPLLTNKQLENNNDSIAESTEKCSDDDVFLSDCHSD